MIETKKFDKEIEKTRAMIDEVASKVEASEKVLEQVAKTDKLGELNFDIENARIEDVLAQQKTMPRRKENSPSWPSPRNRPRIGTEAWGAGPSHRLSAAAMRGMSPILKKIETSEA